MHTFLFSPSVYPPSTDPSFLLSSPNKVEKEAEIDKEKRVEDEVYSKIAKMVKLFLAKKLNSNIELNGIIHHNFL